MTASATLPDLDLLRRYDQIGPRYTSYPTAPRFSTAFRESDFRRFAHPPGDRKQREPLSIYVHVPFCSKPCFYCGCTRIITRSESQAAQYLSRLVDEIELLAPLLPDREVMQLHFGGGTPNFLRPDQLGIIVQALREQFQFSKAGDLQLSIELDPRFTEPRHVRRLAEHGFNRISLGVQDFDADVQAAVNRIQSVEQTLQTIAAAREAGITSINIDLMYGLPRQTPAGFRHTLRTIIDARPSRLAIYGYAHMPELFKAQGAIHADELPDLQTRAVLLSGAIDALTAEGYRYIGMDHFALPEDELVRAQECGTLQRNFMGYTIHAGRDLLGLGVSAISHLGHSYSQNFRDLKSWEAAIDSPRLPLWRGLSLDRDDCIRAAVISQIMCQGDVDICAIESRHGMDFWKYFADARAKLDRLEADGLVWTCGSRIVATPQGRFLLRAIAACFDRYLEHNGAAQPAMAVRAVAALN